MFTGVLLANFETEHRLMCPQMRVSVAHTFMCSILTSKVEDAANNCCVVITHRNCGCGSAPHLKAGWQVHWPSRYFHPPLLLVVILILACGKAACWLWKEEQAGTCNVPCPSDVLCCCWALEFHSHHSFYLEHSHFVFFIDIGAT